MFSHYTPLVKLTLSTDKRSMDNMNGTVRVIARGTAVLVAAAGLALGGQVTSVAYADPDVSYGGGGPDGRGGGGGCSGGEGWHGCGEWHPESGGTGSGCYNGVCGGWDGFNAWFR